MASETRVIPSLVATEDGSLTYLHPVHGASYRSLKGAVTESRLVFLDGSRLAHRPGHWRVLELGFGSGLNFQNTAEAARAAGVALTYVSLEPELIPSDLWLVDSAWKSATPQAPFRQGEITLNIASVRWQDHKPESAAFDAVFHDPFGPAVSPECWTLDSFRWAAKALAPDGVLATYGASSGARRAMREAGLQVGILPGAPGKREMTVAAHSASAISHARLWKAGQPG